MQDIQYLKKNACQTKMMKCVSYNKYDIIIYKEVSFL